MDLLQLPLSALIPTILLIIILTQIKKKTPTKLPPGPWKLPFVGNIHNLLGSVPHRALHKLSKRFGPVMLLKLGQIDHVVISSPEAAREILKTHDKTFASRPLLMATTIIAYNNTDVAFAPYGRYWRQLRKICVVELLSARRVKSYRPIREEENANLVASLSTTGKPVAVNLTEKLKQLANTTTAIAAFSAKCKYGPRFIREVKKAVQLASGFNLVDLYPSLGFLGGLLGTRGKLEGLKMEIDAILENIITEHIEAKNSTTEGVREGEEDLVDVLLRVKEQGGLDFPLSMMNVKAVTLDMFTAGTETSSTTLIWAMSELMLHPAVMKKVQDEVREAAKGMGTVEEGEIEQLYYMKLVIKETLRLHPPVPLSLPRVCGETCNVGGFQIPAGSRVLINVWAIARDPRYWEDAETFKPERFEGSSIDFEGENFQYLPFGGGRRICPGMAFGLATLEITLARLLFHFNWELPEGKELDMTEAFGAIINRKTDLCLIATPHFPVPVGSKIAS